MEIRSIAAFCGSKNGNDPAFVQDASTLGEKLAEKNITVVYGGGSAGLMGSVADGVLRKQGTIIGILPKLMVEWEVAHRKLTELIICDDMHERKKMIYARCDAAIILPGGFGTLDELFEVLTWNQLTIHDKQIGILNTNGFYDSLLQHMEQMNKTGFLYAGAYEKIHVHNTPQAMIEWLTQRADFP